MSPIDPSLFSTYAQERQQRRNAARAGLALHHVLDDEDFASFASAPGGHVRSNRINLALLARYMRARDWPPEQVQAALHLSAEELRQLTDGGLIVGQTIAAAIDKELEERFAVRPDNARELAVDADRRARTIKQDTARRRLYAQLDG